MSPIRVPLSEKGMVREERKVDNNQTGPLEANNNTNVSRNNRILFVIGAVDNDDDRKNSFYSKIQSSSPDISKRNVAKNDHLKRGSMNQVRALHLPPPPPLSLREEKDNPDDSKLIQHPLIMFLTKNSVLQSSTIQPQSPSSRWLQISSLFSSDQSKPVSVATVTESTPTNSNNSYLGYLLSFFKSSTTS